MLRYTKSNYVHKEKWMSRKKHDLKEQIINIHAEAYYKAMRRFDAEQKIEEQKLSNQNLAIEKTKKETQKCILC